ncbi:MAG: ribosome biogenesis GTP-binding protein YihA/YsxC [Albidovulum sp.]|nr:ribosome biogenesis GTP-binding protein YihA/YsxC [Albidovulum sp.]
MKLDIRPASEPSEGEAENARKLFASGCEFVKGVVDIDGLPLPDRVEVCFAGRSNSGKSSLINALTGRKSLARTSGTPGRTQEINYFALGSTHYLVDLPGYGYAKAPKAKVDRWQSLLRNFLQGRAPLRRAFILVDARHGPKQVDDGIMSLLDAAAVPFQIVFTKSDKIGSRQLDALPELAADAIQRHPAAFPEFIATSSVSRLGIDSLRANVAAIG